MSETGTDPALAGTPTGNTSPGLTSAAAVLCVWSGLIFAWRTFVKTRFRKSDAWGIDDSAISLSFLFIIAHLVAVCYAVRRGYGNEWSELRGDDHLQIEKSLFSGQILYIWAMGLTRLSTSFFTTRLSREKRYKPMVHTISGLCLLWTAGSTFAYALRGDLKEPWAQLDGTSVVFVRWVIVEIAGIVIDLVLCCVSCFLIWALHMPILKRLSVMTVFFCRLLVIPIIIVRLIKLQPSQNTDTDKPDTWAMMLTEASMNAAFILASVTCLKAFLRPFGAGYLVSQSDTAPTSGYVTRPRGYKGSAYYMLSGVREKQQDKSATLVNATERADKHLSHELAAVPKAVVARGQGMHRAHIHSQSRSHSYSSSESKQQMIISQTTEWSVSYEYDDDDAKRRDTEPRAI